MYILYRGMETASLAMLEQEASNHPHQNIRGACVHVHVYTCMYNTTKTFHPLKILLQVSNTSKGCVGELSTFCDSTSGVCRYVSSQVNSIHVCICAFSMYVGEQYAFGVVSGGVSNNKKNTSPPTDMDSTCFSG